MDLTLVDSCYSDLSGYLSMAQNHHHLQHLFDESNRFVLKMILLLFPLLYEAESNQ